MGDVAIIYRVMPEDVDVDLYKVLDQIKEKLPEQAKFEGYQIQDIAFGLKALLMRIVVPDKVGGIIENIEKAVEEMEGVQSIEVLEQSLI